MPGEDVSGDGEASYMYHEDTGTPLLGVAIPSGMLLCGSTRGLVRALDSGLRQRLTEFVKGSHSEDTGVDEPL